MPNSSELSVARSSRSSVRSPRSSESTTHPSRGSKSAHPLRSSESVASQSHRTKSTAGSLPIIAEKRKAADDDEESEREEDERDDDQDKPRSEDREIMTAPGSVLQVSDTQPEDVPKKMQKRISQSTSRESKKKKEKRKFTCEQYILLVRITNLLTIYVA